MLGTLFGGGWKMMTGALLKFVVYPALKTAAVPVAELADHIGDFLIVIGAGHKAEKIGTAIKEALNAGK